MKKIVTLLILFSPSYLIAQSITVEIGEYPFKYESEFKDFKVVGSDCYITANDQQVLSNHWPIVRIQDKESSRNKEHYEIRYKNEEKGAVEIVNRLEKDKKLGGFKIINDGKTHYQQIDFALNARLAIAVGYQGNQLFAYCFDMDTRKLVVDAKPFQLDNSIYAISEIGSSGNGEYIYVAARVGNDEYVMYRLGLKTGDINTFSIDHSGEVFPTPTSNYVMIAGNNNRSLYHGASGDLAFSESVDSKRKIRSRFYSSKSEPVSEISGKSLEGPGVGYIIHQGKIVLFDHEGNYFSLTQLSDDLVTYLRFNGGDPLEPQPDLIPILSDQLDDDQIFKLFKDLHYYSHNYNYVGGQNFFKLMESGEPYSMDLLIKISQLKAGDYYELRNYFGIQLVDFINSEEKLSLIQYGKESNKKTLAFLEGMEKYRSYMDEPYHQPYMVDVDALTDAKNKLQAVSSDMYYMTVDELVEKGNQAVKTGASLSPTAALLGIKFYEVAAEKEPNEPIHQLLIANAYANANKYDEALQYYNKALAMKPDYPLALFGIMKTSFMPIQKGQKNLDDNLAKSIIANADRFLAVAPADYAPEMTTAKRYRAFCQLYLDDKSLYAQYNLATGMSDAAKRSEAVASLLVPVERTGNKYLAADMANIIAFDLISVAESKGKAGAEYLKADAMLAKSVKGGVNDAKTYYQWASINIHELKQNEEALRIIDEAKKLYPNDANFDALAVNLYFNKGRELYLAKSYSKAIPYFEKYAFTAANPIAKVYDYLGFSYYRVKNYPKAAENLQKLKDKENANTLQAFYPNFNAVLTFAKNPSGTAPVPQDNGDKIEAMEDKYEKGIGMGGSAGLKLMEEAANYYDQINYDYGQGIAHSGVGVAYHRAGNKSVAKGHYQKCIDNGATSSSCYNNLAMIYTDEKALSSAKSVLDKGWSKFPNAADLKKTYAEYYIQMGFNEYGKKSYYSAITNFKKCISYNDSDAWAHMYLGYSYYATGKSYDAKSSLRKAIQLDPKLRNEYPAIGQILNQ